MILDHTWQAVVDLLEDRWEEVRRAGLQLLTALLQPEQRRPHSADHNSDSAAGTQALSLIGTGVILAIDCLAAVVVMCSSRPAQACMPFSPSCLLSQFRA